MTREDARKTIDDILACFGNKPEDGTYELTQLDAKDMREAIKVLEQEPCEELEFIQPHKKVSVNLEVCTDTISRQAVLTYIEFILTHGMGKKKSFEFIKKFVGKLPSVTPKQRWIPVHERLPEEYCLFCDIDGDVFYGHIYDGRWWAEGQDDRIKNVIAWMPRPEPYRAESER